MEKIPNEQNEDNRQTQRVDPVNESAPKEHSSHSGSHRSSGSHSSTHSSSSGHSSSHDGSSSHSHSSSGNHGSSRDGSSGHSSSHSGKSKDKSEKSKISLYKRVRHKIKYFYWKYKRRLKKASRIKKAGYLVILICIMLFIAVMTKFAINRANNTKDPTGSQVVTMQTTIPPTTVKPAPIPPAVVTFYQINDTYKVDESFSSGFMVELPNIFSKKPLAVRINAEMDKIKQAVKNTYNSVDNIKTYREQYNYSYDSFVKDNILFISVFTSHNKKSGDVITSNKYYAYNFETDKIINNSEIISMFNLEVPQIVDITNSALRAVGAVPIDNIDNFKFFVKENGKLFADVKVTALMGGTYSELVQLT